MYFYHYFCALSFLFLLFKNDKINEKYVFYSFLALHSLPLILGCLWKTSCFKTYVCRNIANAWVHKCLSTIDEKADLSYIIETWMGAECVFCSLQQSNSHGRLVKGVVTVIQEALQEDNQK